MNFTFYEYILICRTDLQDHVIIFSQILKLWVSYQNSSQQEAASYLELLSITFNLWVILSVISKTAIVIEFLKFNILISMNE